MRYTGTIKQANEFIRAMKRTGNYTIRKEDNGEGGNSAYSSVYELYLDMKAKTAIDTGFILNLFAFPHTAVRVMYFKRENKAEITIGSDSVVKVCALYPSLAKLLADMDYRLNNHRTSPELKKSLTY